MIEIVFTLDYEVYGNGKGSLQALVYEPASRFAEVFTKHGSRYVAFVEVAELERIEGCFADPAIDLVTRQIFDLNRSGFELGLHIHPQWCNSRFENGEWVLDPSEYNLCTLPVRRIVAIVEQSVRYLRRVIRQPGYTPLAFRAGNWLLQPTGNVAKVLAECGIKIDSSVFKGGVQHSHGLDYRPAMKNVYYWRFSSDVNRPDPKGAMLELPIHTEMVFPWHMATSKRLKFKGPATPGETRVRRLSRTRDLLRFRYPRKLDFCRMTLEELTQSVDKIVQEDRKNAERLVPIVAIGHTKDFTDTTTVDAFLSFLKSRDIRVSTFSDIYPRVTGILPQPVAAYEADAAVPLSCFR